MDIELRMSPAMPQRMPKIHKTSIAEGEGTRTENLVKRESIDTTLSL